MSWQAHIEPSLFHGTHLIEDVERAIQEGEMFLFAMDDAAAVVEIIEYPRLTSLHMPFCGGKLKTLTNIIIPAAEIWGSQRGCTRFTGCGRAGWDRVMSLYGYSTIGHFWAKEIAS